MGRKARSVPAMSPRSPRDTTPGPWATSPASRWTLEVSPSTPSGASALAYCPCRPNSMTDQKTDAPPAEREDFIREIVKADLASGRAREVVTRFPPEPNGYLHIGHAKSICLNFGVAEEFGGRCNLRFDDTNPTREEQEYIDAIEGDVRWLGFDWGTHLHHASDYFEQLYRWAEHLIEKGKAYVDDQSQEEMRLTRGTLTEPGRNSP